MIDWTGFTWEAFATLATGGAAVSAATFVALRQLSIVRRQVEVDELRLRHDLFDRRAAVFNSVRQYLGLVLFGGIKPDYDSFERFYLAIETSRFVFSAPVHLELRAVKAFASDYVDLLEVVAGGDEDGWRDVLEQKTIELRRRYDSLPNLVEAEMDLAHLRRPRMLRTWRTRFQDWRDDRKRPPDEIGGAASNI